MSALRYGWVGLGAIGTPMAQRLAGWPGGLTVFDVRGEAMRPLVDAGAQPASSVAELAARADLVSVMVLDDAQVRDLVAELRPALAPGSLLAVHSTIRAETAEQLAAELAPDGIAVLDAPVSGGMAGAAGGRLAVLVGGERDAYERCKEPFRRFADLVVHMGPAGAGTRAKVARNLVTFAGFAAAAEAQRLAEAAGIDLRKLAGVVRHSDAVTGGAGAIMLRSTTGPLAADDPLRDVLVHTRSLGEKDLALALELGDELGVELPFARLALDRLADGLGVPHGGSDGT